MSDIVYAIEVAAGTVRVTVPPGDHPPLLVFLPSDAKRIELDLSGARIDPNGLRPEGTAALTLIPSDTAVGVRPMITENPAEFRISGEHIVGGAVLLSDSGGASGGRFHSIRSAKDDGVVIGDPSSGAGRMGPWDGSGGDGVR